jgi:hypothetical protein
MKWMRTCAALLVMLAGCKTVVTTTTEIRPSRYAAIEFTRQVSHDAVMKYAAQAVEAENLNVQQIDQDGGTLTAGPAKYPATADGPALDATLMISTETTGNETRIRIFASSAIEQDQVGGKDARLASLVQRVNQRMDTLIGQ